MRGKIAWGRTEVGAPIVTVLMMPTRLKVSQQTIDFVMAGCKFDSFPLTHRFRAGGAQNQVSSDQSGRSPLAFTANCSAETAERAYRRRIC
jgi:hypothetical protein